MMKKLRIFCLILVLALLPLSLVGCSDSKTLKSDQYHIYNKGNRFTIEVTDTDINADDIETVKVKIRYKSINSVGLESKAKTETFEVEKFDNAIGNFIGGFETENPVSEFECKKVEAYYAENSDPNDIYISVPEAIGFAIGLFILGLIIWFILAFTMTDIDVAFYIAVAPYVLCFIGMLITGQWIPALIFFIGIGALVTFVQTIFQKFLD